MVRSSRSTPAWSDTCSRRSWSIADVNVATCALTGSSSRPQRSISVQNAFCHLAKSLAEEATVSSGRLEDLNECVRALGPGTGCAVAVPASMAAKLAAPRVPVFGFVPVGFASLASCWAMSVSALEVSCRNLALVSSVSLASLVSCWNLASMSPILAAASKALLMVSFSVLPTVSSSLSLSSLPPTSHERGMWRGWVSLWESLVSWFFSYCAMVRRQRGLTRGQGKRRRC